MESPAIAPSDLTSRALYPSAGHEWIFLRSRHDPSFLPSGFSFCYVICCADDGDKNHGTFRLARRSPRLLGVWSEKKSILKELWTLRETEAVRDALMGQALGVKPSTCESEESEALSVAEFYVAPLLTSSQSELL